MVSSPERLAKMIAMAILRKGRNAFNVAATVRFAVAVTLPEARNLGGGGFAIG